MELEIQSPSLCDEFRKLVNATYQGSNLKTSPIKLRMPFHELFFYRAKVKEALEDMSRSQQLRNDLQLLHDFIPKHGVMSSIVDDYEKYKLQNQVVGDIVWTMFPPNTLMVVKTEGGEECWICRNVQSLPQEIGLPLCVITGLRVGFNGKSPGLVRRQVRFPAHPLQVFNMTDLPAIPMAYYEDWDNLKRKLQKRAGSLETFLGERLDSYHCCDYEDSARPQAAPRRRAEVQVGSRISFNLTRLFDGLG